VFNQKTCIQVYCYGKLLIVIDFAKSLIWVMQGITINYVVWC